MKLTKLERRLLLNQYEIRKRLEGVDHYDEIITILEKGFSLFYQDVVDFLYDDLPEERCRFVLDVLDMYRALDSFFRGGKQPELEEEPMARFAGFDGNNETQLMAFTKFLIEEQDKYGEQKARASTTDGFNSHMPVSDNYRSMLQAWKERGRSFKLSEEDAKAILAAARRRK